MFPPLAALGLRAINSGYAPIPGAEVPADSIVVLSGHVAGPDEQYPTATPHTDTAERLRHAATLYRTWRKLPIIVTGGTRDLSGVAFAVTMKRELVRMGVPEEDIWTEEQSTNTHENALFSAKLLAAKGLKRPVVVTSCYHMLRTEMCFKKQGFEVYPAPVGIPPFELRLASFIPNDGALLHNEHIAHELVGIAFYKARGQL
ncbi:MAG: YdcF family protein [Bryobacterales bacterium]|nr:YdcF family protein [Bryobacterales bacterium]